MLFFHRVYLFVKMTIIMIEFRKSEMVCLQFSGHCWDTAMIRVRDELFLFFFFFLCSVRSSKYLFSLKKNLSCLIIFRPLRFFLLCSRDKEYQKFLALKSRNISQSSTVHIRTILLPPSRAKLQIVWYFRRKYMLIIIIYSLFNNFPQSY